ALVLPGGAGTELARGYYVFRNAPNAKTAALSTVVLDRILGLFALVFLGVLAFLGLLADDAPLNINIALMGVATIALFLGTCLGFGLIGFSPSRRLILSLVPRRFAEPVNSMVYAYLHGKRAIAYGVILSVGAHLMLMGSFMIAGYILGTPLGWREVFLIVPLVTISNIIPISPAGIGIGEVTASFLFAQFDIANGAAIMFVVRMWMILSQLLGGLVYLFYRDSLSE
ncbi:MAG TPA: flippase-like domain-containing protein, partial [Rhodospirillaceae bacterium]|nr:flippase-like domain-containing protein [Rhodospirillaceae bacterium]